MQPGHPFLDLERATLGRAMPDTAEQNPGPLVVPFSSIPTTEPYFPVTRRGKALNLNSLTSPGGILIVHVDRPGNPFYLTPGQPVEIPRRFEKLFLQRPTSPLAVPADPARNYILDIAEDIGFFKPVNPPALLNQSGSLLTSTTVVTIAEGAPQLLIAARPGRTRVKFSLSLDSASGNSPVDVLYYGPDISAAPSAMKDVSAGSDSTWLNTTVAYYAACNGAPGHTVKVLVEEEANS